VQDVKTNESADTLFSQIKRQWKKYVNESDNHINVCAGDCVFTYFQDRLGSTHYLFFVADTEAGKTTNLRLYQKLGYRAFLGLDISTANIYRFYGNEYEGIGTLLEDEIDNLDEQTRKFKMYKSGYTKGIKVPKSEKPSESEGFEQEGYYTYGFKAFAAERMPSSTRAKGFKDRTIQMPCSFGLPEIYLDDVLDNADDPMYKPLLTELNALKNRLLIYRMLHYFVPIPNIDKKLQAREKQLWNPLLRVFQNTQTYGTLRKVATEFIKESRVQKSHSHTAFLLNIIIELQLENQGSLTFPTSDIWQKYKDMLPEGEETGKTSYRSDEFGDMSQKRLNEILADQFKAWPPRHTGKKRELVFDKNALDRLKQKYRIKLGNNQPETDETDETLETDVSLDKHMSEQNSNDKTLKNEEEKSNNSIKDEEKEENYMH
jgi:hypothetical protein